jgi:vacuolar-type H+-ATPase subunit F/Vma7
VGVLVVIGEASRVDGFALGGAVVMPADDPDDVRRAWSALPEDAEVVVLTRDAASAIRGSSPGTGILVTVMPP